MSRCFPFPPPGYVRLSGDRSDQSLIESIKLQKVKERAKKEKKDKKKREKKEKSNDHQSSKCNKQSQMKRKHDEVSQLSGKDGYYKQAKEHAAEQLEKSGLTEENGPPAFIQNLYDSDSTQDCRKKQRVETPNVNQKNEEKATLIRIRFPSMKLKDGELPNQKPAQVKKEDAELPRFNGVKLPLVKRNHAELGRPSDVKLPSVKNENDLRRPNDLNQLLVKNTAVELRNSNGPKLYSVKHEGVEIRSSRDPKLPIVKSKHAERPSPTLVKHNHAAHDVKLHLVKEKDIGLHRPNNLKLPVAKHKDSELARPSDLKQHVPADEPCSSGRVETPLGSTSHTHREGSHRVRKFEKKFRDLIMNWNPPPMEYLRSSDSDGLDWLLDSQRRQSGVVPQNPDVSCKASEDMSANGGSLQMRACYLPDNDIYALPYVMPY